MVETYVYDESDRLVEVRDHGGATVATYYYDPFGRRLWKKVDGVSTYFLYSKEGLIGEYDGTGTEIRTYGYALGSQWTTNPLFVKSAGVYYWYQNDHLGTSQKITRTNGSVAGAAEYDSFGNVQITTEDITNNLRFSGQYYDTETGFHYNWNRYYDPAIGRYLRVDPAGDGLNLYTYVFNNPLIFIDPEGLVARGLAKGVADMALEDAWYSQANATVGLAFDTSPAGLMGQEYATPFSPPASLEEELGYNLAPAVPLATLLLSLSPKAITSAYKAINKGVDNIIDVFDNSRAVNFVDDIVPKRGASFGESTTTNYKKTFFKENPSLEGDVAVHHGVEQQTLKRYPGVVSESKIHSMENLRGIPKNVNSDIHLSKIRKE